MKWTQAASVLIIGVLLVGCDDRNSGQSVSAASEAAVQAKSDITASGPEVEDSSAINVESSAVGETTLNGHVSFQILGDNRDILEKYNAQKNDAESVLAEIQQLVGKNQTVMAHFKRDEPSVEITEHSQALQGLADQAIQKFGVGIMSPPLGECGALADAAADYWQELLQAKTDKRKPDPSFKSIYQDGIALCREEIENPPKAQVTIKLNRGTSAPVEGCRKVPEFNSAGELIETGKMVCPANAIDALK